MFLYLELDGMHIEMSLRISDIQADFLY